MRDLQVCPRRLSLILVILTLCISEQVLAQSSNTFPMPKVIGLTIPEAEKRVYAAGRSIRAKSAKAQIVERRSNSLPAGRIIRQLESPGTPMSYGTDDLEIFGEVTFQIVVSTGPDQARVFDERSVSPGARNAAPGSFQPGVITGQRMSRIPDGISVEAAQPANTFPMPNVTGLTIREAEKKVYSAGRSIGASNADAQVVERRVSERPAGQIIRQLESPGTPMAYSTDDVNENYGEVSFRVVLSSGPDQAQNNIENSVDRPERNERQDRPSLAEQAISGFFEGLFNRADQSRDTFPMPEVIGLTVTEAEERVYSAGRAIGASSADARIVERRSDERPAGQIIQQLERPGTPMRPYMDDVGGNYGEVRFQVVVSTGPSRPTTFPMPNVIGLTIAEAEERVYSAGQATGARSADARIVERRSDERPAGQIIQQLERTGTPMRPYMDDVGGNYGEVRFQVVISTGPEPAPNFVGDTVDTARLYAGQNDITMNVGPGQRNPRIAEGIVIRQSPAAGQPMSRRQVTVYPSTGYPLPNYVGQGAEVARLDSEQLEFDLEEQTIDNVGVRRGVIFEQDPEAGALLPIDRPVNVLVSNGWPTPDFRTLGENEAMSLAAEKQVDLEVAERRREREMNPGIVIDQNPSPGAVLAPNQAVGVVISAPDLTPRLIALMESEALTVAAGRNFSLVIRREASIDYAFGLVSRQSPVPGDPLPVDGRVSVVISTGPLTPDFVGKTEKEATRVAADMDIVLISTSPGEHFELLAGRIIAQQPVAGVELPIDRQVSISLSLGWPVAPDAVGRPFVSVKRNFLARHPNANVEKTESLLTIEPAGTVISQHPQPGAKLDTKQRLSLVASATRPAWLWAVSGVVLVALTWGGVAVLSSMMNRTTLKSISTENPGGVHLRVTKDHGVQSTEMRDDSHTGDERKQDVVKIKVKVDLGEQSAGPIDDKGERT